MTTADNASPAMENHWHINQEESVVDYLHGVSGLSKTKLKLIMQKGAVWLTHGEQIKRIRRGDKMLKKGDVLHFYYDENVLNTVPSEPELIADEGGYSIWNKPYGLRSQGSKWGDHCAINRWVEKNHKPQRPAFIVHRLDRAATGLIIIAHSKKIAVAFSALFQSREINKCYHVWVHGKFPDTKKSVTYSNLIDDKSAVSHVILLDYNIEMDQSLLKVEIETGRKHQIRRHLSVNNFQVVGDRLYGNNTDECNLKLIAVELSFISPIDESRKEYSLVATME